MRFLHNLSRPIAEQLPSGSIVAAAPFVDDGDAAERLHGEHGLIFIADAEHLEASRSFLAGAWHIEALRFVSEGSTRRLHGKAYWSSDGHWTVVGSPNLTASALLATPRTGNLEAAVLLNGVVLDLPDNEPVDLDQLLRSAPDRLDARPVDAPASVTWFHSYFEDGMLRADLADGIQVERATQVGWMSLGLVANRCIRVADADSPPTRLRALLPDGRTALSIVQYVAQLRARRSKRAVGRAAEAVERPPLDIQGVEALRAVLLDLYALDQLISDARAQTAPSPDAPQQRVLEPIDGWRPAHPRDAPRIPDLYERVWPGAPDALLALVRHALRLDLDEMVEERLDEYTDGTLADREAAHRADPPRRNVTTRDVLRTYRRSIVKALGRGAERVRAAVEPAVADLTFLTVLQFYEKLAETRVFISTERAEPDQLGEPLVALRDVIPQKLDLIDAYSRRADLSQLEARQAMFAHLGDCLAHRYLLTDHQRRRLDTICDSVAADLLASETANPSKAGTSSIDPTHAASLLRPYLDRSELLTTVEFAEDLLGTPGFDIVDGLGLVVSGAATFDDIRRSPAWPIIGHGAHAAFVTGASIMVAIENLNPAYFARQHVLLADIPSTELREAVERRIDGHWLVRHARSVGEQTLERLGEAAAVTIAQLNWTSYDDNGMSPPPWLPREVHSQVAR